MKLGTWPCLCCEDWGRFVGSGELPCPSCGHTVEQCDSNETPEDLNGPPGPAGLYRSVETDD